MRSLCAIGPTLHGHEEVSETPYLHSRYLLSSGNPCMNYKKDGQSQRKALGEFRGLLSLKATLRTIQ